MWKYHENIAWEGLKGRHWHWKVLCFTSPFTCTYLRQTQLLMRQMEAMSLSLFSLDGVCFPTLVFNLIPFFLVLYFCTFDSDSPNESLISFPWCNLSSSLLCVQTGIITKHTAQHSSQIHVNEGQRATSHSGLLPQGSNPPDTLFTPPQPSDRAEGWGLPASHYPIRLIWATVTESTWC